MNKEDYAVCPRCHMSVSVYIPDCPYCGYFIWGDDIEDGEQISVGNYGAVFDDDDEINDALEMYYDYDEADFKDDWEYDEGWDDFGQDGEDDDDDF